MSDFKAQWNLAMALEVLGGETVDGKVWSEAARWLLFYGPPQLRELLSAASADAFARCFPGVMVKGHSDSGQPYYDLDELASAMELPLAEMVVRLTELQEDFGADLLVEGDRVYKLN